MKIPNDKYYTPKDLAKRLIDLTFEKIGKENITEIIEPSAGNGSFSSQMECKAFDIEPEAEGIKKQDYLQAFLGYKKGRLIIGNPPFGDSNWLIIKFWERSIEIADYIAFILPISFLNNNIRLYQFDLIHSEDLGEQEYSGVNLHCCFNIYKRPKSWLNKKPNYRNDRITFKEYRRTATSDPEKIPKNWDCAFCNWGNGTFGKVPEYVGQYAQEVYVYVNDDSIRNKVKELCSYDNLRKKFSSVSMLKASVMAISRYLNEEVDRDLY